jgi:hypothetical protein
MRVYAVREYIPYESNDIVKLFTTRIKAEFYIAKMLEDPDYNLYELKIDEVEVE